MTLLRPALLALVTMLLTPLAALAAVDIQQVTSPGGIRAWLVEEHSIPFTAMEIRFRGGTSLDPDGKRGAVNLMAGLLEEGAAGMSAQDFAAGQESLAASFDFDSSRDSVGVSARFLSENRDQAIELLRKALVQPDFPPDAIARVKGQVDSIIRSDATDPGSVAGNTFARLAWGDQPYGTDDNGTLESVAALTRDDLIAAKARTMARDRLYVGVVGDITPAELGPMLDRLLGDLPAKGTVALPEKAEYRLKPGTTVVPFDTPQSVAIFAEQGIPLKDPDYFPAYVLMQALGGGNFSSVLMDELREKRGLTYGVGAYLSSMDLGDLIVGQFASDNAKMGTALDVLKAAWARVAQDGLTEAQVEDAKTYLTGAYPLRWDGNARIARIIVGMQMDGFPIDYARTRNQRVEAVTVEQVNHAAKRLLHADRLGIVVVGHPQGVAASGTE